MVGCKLDCEESSKETERERERKRQGLMQASGKKGTTGEGIAGSRPWEGAADEKGKFEVAVSCTQFVTACSVSKGLDLSFICFVSFACKF